MENLYQHPSHLPLDVRGPLASHVAAFAVHDHAQCVIAVAAPLYASLGLAVGQAPVGAVWGDTEVLWPQAEGPQQRPAFFTDHINGRHHRGDGQGWPVGSLLRDFPVAALTAPIVHAA